MQDDVRLALQRLFEVDLHLLENPVCKECDAQLRHPLLPWVVGPRFNESTERILFVGKPHRGTPGVKLTSGLINPSDMVLELWNEKWPYWSYTREVAEKLYGSDAINFIAFTNLIKCTNVGADDGESTAMDKTTYSMAECCVLKLGVIWKEIELIKPRTLVFYTYGLFRKTLEQVPIRVGRQHEGNHPSKSFSSVQEQTAWLVGT
jgi:hypothetical protein